MSKFIIEPHFRLQEWVAEEKGYFRAEGLDYEFRELIRSTEGQHHNKANQGAFQSIEKGREANVSCACHWTVNVAASNGHAKLYADVYSVAPSGIFVPCGFSGAHPERPRRRAHLGRLSVRKPLLDDTGAGAVHGSRRDQPDVRRRHAVSPDGAPDRGQEPGSGAFQRAVLPGRAIGFPQSDRHQLHDRGDDQGRRSIRKTSGATSAPCAARSAISTCGRNATRTTTRTNSRIVSMPRWIRAAGGRASGSCSRPIRRKYSSSRSSGSQSTKFLRKGEWDRGNTIDPPSRLLRSNARSRLSSFETRPSDRSLGERKALIRG